MPGGFYQDLKYGARTMRRSPGLSLAIVLTLALGIGASTALFTVVYGILFRALPYHDAERLAVIRLERVAEGVQRPVRSLFALEDLADLRSGTRAFDSIAFYSTDTSTLAHQGFTEEVSSASVSAAFFATIAGPVQAGRGLIEADEHQASVVVSDRLRRRLFGDDQAVGRTVALDSRTYEIVGVASPAFQVPLPGTDVWLLAAGSRCCPFAAVARLRPGASTLQAAADVDAILRLLAAKSPRVYGGTHASVLGVREELVGDVRTALWMLLGAAGLLLAISCANATTLLLGRNATRSREMAIRIAVGASRRRLCAQYLAEGVLPIAAAGAIGMLLAAVLVEALVALHPSGFPRLDLNAVRIDGPVFLFALSVVAATTLVVGLLPALMTNDAGRGIRIDAAGTSAAVDRRRVFNALVVLQLAVSVILLVGATLLGRSLVRLMTTDIGVRTDHVATAAVNLSHQRRLSDAQQITLVDAVLERLRALPHVEAVGAGAALPPHASTIRLTLKRSGDTVDYEAAAVPATPGYFSALGVRLIEGRLFSDRDSATAPPVMIMTADTARRFFGAGDAIGRTMSLPVLRDGTPGQEDVTLVGVISNVKYSGLQAAPDDAVYRPLRQQAWPVLFVVARTAADPRELASMLRRELAAVDRAIAVSSVNTLDAIVSAEAAQPRFRSRLLAALAAMALGIAAVGLYGVVAHGVSQRTKELGVRMALGADRANLLALVFREGAALAGAGVVLGVAGSLAATRLLSNLLYGIGPTDGMSFVLAAGVLLLVAGCATYLPARRASRLDPAVALRAE